MVRNSKKLPAVMTEDELKALLAQPNPKCPTGLRNLCMMRLMCNAGLRVAEVLNLKVK
jgi:site-specific recombinase XerD